MGCGTCGGWLPNTPTTMAPLLSQILVLALACVLTAFGTWLIMRDEAFIAFQRGRDRGWDEARKAWLKELEQRAEAMVHRDSAVVVRGHFGKPLRSEAAKAEVRWETELAEGAGAMSEPVAIFCEDGREVLR